MAVSIDTVYQRVLAMANKEQRGYVTPQEYNLLANQAQMQIFESYFYSKNRREKLDHDHEDHESTETDLVELMSKKLAPFTTIQTVTSGHTFPPTVSSDPVFQTGKIWYNGRVCQYVEPTEVEFMKDSVRHSAATDGRGPVWTNSNTSGRDILVYAPAVKTSGITCECITRPDPVAWGYIVVNGKALYNSNTSTDFPLHISEEDTLVNKILELAGVVINKPGLVTIAANQNQNEFQQQNT